MIEIELQELVQRIRNTKAEFQTIEIKKALTGTPEKLYDTLSSFSNQDDGGTIVFGIDENNDFDICGVNDVQNLQKKVMEQCNQMEPKVRAVFTCAEINGKNIVSAEIPPIDITLRPCFYAAKGRIKGSYIRIGDADIPMTEYEIYSYEAYRKKYQDDIREVPRATKETINAVAFDKYMLLLKENRPNFSHLSDEQILSLSSMIHNGNYTLASVMLFSICPQMFFPQLSIIATVVPGTEIGDIDQYGSRFTDNKRIEGTIPEMLSAAMTFIKNNMRTKVIIEEGIRIDKTEYPLNSLREIILNALVHRDYSIHTEGMPIQLTIYSDRLEIKNPGGLYGRLTVDTLGKVQPDTRNPVLATALETMKITENRYSGIPTIRREFREWGLPEPEFRNERGMFSVCLRKNVANIHVDTDITELILDFCKNPRTRKEIAEFLNFKSETYVINKYIKPLIHRGLISLSVPDKPSSSKQRFTTSKNL